MHLGRTRRLAALAAAALLGASACSSAKSGDSVGAARRSGSVPAKLVQLGSDVVKQRGGTLRVAVAGLDGLDPAAANEASASQMLVMDLLYDGLTRHNPNDDGRVSASVARSWAVTNDGLLWEFHLDPDARFSTGQAIKSSDVKASLERVAARGSESLSGVQLASVKGYGDFVAKRTPNLSGLKADDPNKLVIMLDAPFSSLPELLASPVFGITAAIKQPNEALITSGGFAVHSRTAQSLELARTERSIARLDAVNIAFVKDADAGLAKFNNGEVDVAAVPVAKAAPAGEEARTVAAPYGASYFYGVNVAAPGLDDPEVRQGIVQAIDRDAIRAKHFAGTADVMTGLIPPGVRGRRDNACGKPCSYDSAAAKTAFDKAFAGKTRPTIHVDYYDEPTGREAGVAKMIADALTTAGLPTEARAHSFAEYRTFAASGRAELFRFGWIGTFPSPDAYLSSLFGSASADNVFGLKDAEIDGALGDARKAVDDATRTTKYLAVEDRVFAQMPLLPLMQLRSVFAVSAAVQNVEVGPQGTIDIDVVWIR